MNLRNYILALSFPALLALLLGFNVSPTQAQDDELLPAEEAFAFSAKAIDSGIQAQWVIADGYYMYRDKLSFDLTDSVGNPIEIKYPFPTSKTKDDPIFGDVEVYTKHADFNISPDSSATNVILTVKGQGCNEPIGVCYPPMKQSLALTLIASQTSVEASTTLITPQMNSTLDTTGELNSIDELRDLLGTALNDDELLPPDEAFKVSAIQDQAGINVRFDIADGYYLYQDKIKFSSSSHQLDQPNLPEGELKQDEYFGDVIVYKHQIDTVIKLISVRGGETLSLNAQYQGCAEAGVCYPPQNKSFTLSIADLITSAQAQSNSVQKVQAQSQTPNNSSQSVEPISEQDKMTSALRNDKIWITLLLFFGAGLLLTFTPCVFPMIPILSGIIVGQGENISTRKAFYLSLVYVLAMAMTYTVIGILVGLSGENIQAWFQTPWIIYSFVAIFVILSLSMFGFYELQMPASFQNKLNAMSNSQQGGNMIGVAIMGFLSALIVGPCVTAPLVGALIYIAETGDATIGGMALFSLSMGMGAPLLLIGMSAGKFLPKAGSWMNAVKAVFGVMLLGLAIWLAERVTPAWIIMGLWAMLMIVSAIYMGAIDKLAEDCSGWKKLYKGLGLLMLVYGIILIIGLASGNRNLFQPLKGINSSSNTAVSNEHLNFIQIKGVDGFNMELAKAKAAGKSVMLDFYADWCVSCKEMETFTFSDPAVQKALDNVVLLQADVTPNDEIDKALYKHFGIIGPPSIMFFDVNGVERRNYRIVGYMPADKFIANIKRALN